MQSVFSGHFYFWAQSSLLLFLLLLALLECYGKVTEPKSSSGNLLRVSMRGQYNEDELIYSKKASNLSFSTSSLSCEDLKGIGSLNTTCLLNSSMYLDGDICLNGTGSLEVSAHVLILCPFKGCSIAVNVSGNVKIGPYASVVGGSIEFDAANFTLGNHATINTTSLGGRPPAQTSGTPIGHDGAGGGHGGRGATCVKNNQTNWGGDVYSWSSLDEPWSYGSKGGSLSPDEVFGGGGGGRILLKVKEILQVDGFVGADGGDGGQQGGGGSGGSIIVEAFKLRGNGTISAAGGSGWGGGGGGRICLVCYGIQDVKITAHGGQSIGCPANGGAAGTIYDKKLRSLKVSNDNFTTHTETPLLDFPTTQLLSNVFIECYAKALVPLLWTRLQVRGQIRLLDGGSICFGLSEYPVSEFELVAEELLMSDSMIKVYGAFRIYVKMLLMWNSRLQIDGGGNEEIDTSLLEVRNLVVLRQKSVISSNADLGVHGQGLLKLSGNGDAIEAHRLFLSQFYSIEVGHGSLLQAPLDDEIRSNSAALLQCESQICPDDLIAPPDDCHVNNTFSFTLQICRVEDISISGVIRGSIIHIHRARTVTINSDGMLTASELGCVAGVGRGKFLKHGVGGGAGYGGTGGSGFYKGTLIEGGKKYGNADLPCELGSGSGSPTGALGYFAGGGMIVIGSMKWPLASLEICGSLNADGQSHRQSSINRVGPSMGGLGGGSGGTVLLFLQTIQLENNASLSVSGGDGGPLGGGGGGGGRIHFDWSNIATGEEYVPIANIIGSLISSGGAGNSGGHQGEDGTITGKKCPKGLYGRYCNECPIGTYKDVVGSDASLCIPCPLDLLPHRADFIYVRGGVTDSFCPYKCLSDKYRMPKCYTPLEELLYTFGGPWIFALLLSILLVFLAFLLSALKSRMIRTEFPYHVLSSFQHDRSDSSPFLLSLAQVAGTSRVEETQSHVYRMYFMGPNTFREPWHLPYSPPDAIRDIVYEDAFNRFIDEINVVAAYEWWEGSMHSILSIIAYPCSWSWKQWRRRKKILRLQEYVKSEYDHACLRSCRSRALYKGMKVGSTPDLMIAYIDFFLGGDERRLDVPSAVLQRFPMCILFGGDGSFMAPYNLHGDILLSNLLGQHMSTAIWNRLVDGLNAQLRTVTQGSMHSSLYAVLSWLSSHCNTQLETHGVKIELGWFQATASGYYQLGIFVLVDGHFFKNRQPEALETNDQQRKSAAVSKKGLQLQALNQPSVSDVIPCKKKRGVIGGIINDVTLSSLNYKRDYLFPFSLLLRNTRPVGFQAKLQFLISILLLGDFSITLLMLIQYYWISLGAFLAILLILPLSLLSPFPAGLNAFFCQGPRRCSLTRIYALWNITSISNTIIALVCGVIHYVLLSFGLAYTRREDSWWILPTVLLVKSLQSSFVDWHIANIELTDQSLFSTDPDKFWSL